MVDKKIPTDFIIKYNGITNSQQGEIGENLNTPQEIIPVIERPKYYINKILDSEFIKLSAQQLYLTKEEKSATFKINTEDNFIEAYELSELYVDGIDLAGLRFREADIQGNVNILENLTVNKKANINSLNVSGITFLNNDVNSANIKPLRNNNNYDLGETDNKWDNIYGNNAYFDRIYINGQPINSNIPTAGAGTHQFWIGGGSRAPGWGNTLTGDLILNSTNGATGNNIPTNITSTQDAGAVFRCSGAGFFGKNLTANKVFNAVYNDYAEYRTTINLEPGRVVIDCDDGSLECASKRLQPGAQIISDTFGHSMGYDENHQTPLAVAGRVLVYTYQDRNNYHAGMAVCSAPNGTVDIMSREEIREYPDCIIGTVSEIPNYDNWGSDNIKVNKRIWIKIK